MITAVEKRRLVLLSYSQNMLNASVAQDWERYTELELQWPKMLEQSINEFGSGLDDIGGQLLEDNNQIRVNIAEAQKSLLHELEQYAKKANSAKSYLK